MRKLGLLAMLALTACETPEDKALKAELAQQDTAECQAMGILPDSPRYANCMSIVAHNRTVGNGDASDRLKAATTVIGEGRGSLGSACKIC